MISKEEQKELLLAYTDKSSLRLITSAELREISTRKWLEIEEQVAFLVRNGKMTNAHSIDDIARAIWREAHRQMTNRANCQTGPLAEAAQNPILARLPSL